MLYRLFRGELFDMVVSSTQLYLCENTSSPTTYCSHLMFAMGSQSGCLKQSVSSKGEELKQFVSDSEWTEAAPKHSAG